MYVLIIESGGAGNKVLGPMSLEDCREAARKDANNELTQIDPAPNAVESWWIDGTDVSYSIHELAPTPDSDAIRIEKARDTPQIVIDADKAEELTSGGYGPTVADIDVLFSDGRYSRFFITIGINKRSQAVCEVATNRRDLQVTRKEVTALRKDPISDHPTMGD